ncbi:hypothetical protein H0G86_002784 [Trichoderma simmonsii]|uniref:Extracellular serine-rich protein n=2 Tax=Trichoderma TaxID=5543 RepID=A0A1T3CL64_9HYPO|nr:hypothetical protein A0O28_0102950 [Trichoderma guizhouense]QYS95492.1 hypothetical protein H0G86_002784 [Trichoderma simmonsii]
MYASSIFTILAAAVASVSAVPTPTEGNMLPSRTFLTGVTHSVVVGRGGLHFDPENVVAQIGDTVEWHFTAANHSLAQSDFAHPCNPLADGTGFFAGFNFVTAEGQNPNVYQITVVDNSPVWYYCPQPKGEHCVNGMLGVINQNFDGDKTLSNQKNIAKSATLVIPPTIQGGKVGGFQRVNPNPLSGF